MTTARAGIAPACVALIGGAEDKTGPAHVLRHVLALTGRQSPTVGVCASASADPAERLATYEEAFGRWGASVVDLSARDSDHANSPELARAVADVDVVFVTGGNQSVLVQLLTGSRLAEAVLVAGARGVVLAGTSAGAAAAATSMIAGGEPAGHDVRLAAGLGWLPNVVVDQHFSQRARQPRLAAAVAAVGRDVTGVGVDEDTVAVVRSGQLSVAGSGTVTVRRGEQVTVVGAAGQIPLTRAGWASSAGPRAGDRRLPASSHLAHERAGRVRPHRVLQA